MLMIITAIPSPDSGVAKNNLLHRQSCAWVLAKLQPIPSSEDGQDARMP
ncbi:TPA: hypothetical protein QD004_000764 [Shewanella algae]|nr:hypothetical protein [Shewanella algae]HDS1201497.1 hypothetical protein [Shewanella algae]